MLSPERVSEWAGGALLADTYRLGRPIGRGGMGELFEATHARLPGRFAVKILAPELTANREAFARFCREAEILSELRHPNVVQIFDFNTAPDERPYFVMEYLEGRDLQARLADSEPLTLPAVVRVVEAVASALAAAHAHGIVHRDLKPANIFLVAVDGQLDELVKVLNFGISEVRATTTLRALPTKGAAAPQYMSPEQVRGGTVQIDGRSDQFALGAIAYRMLTGHDAFEAPEISAVLYQIAHEPARPIAHHLPVSWDTRPLQAVLDRALAKNPADRWGGMMELARAFEAAAERTLPQPVPIVLDSPRSAPAPIVLDSPRFTPPAIALDGPIGTLDQIPVTRHRAATAGVVVVMLAGLLAATGWYRRIPASLTAAMPRVRNSLAAWLQPKQPARPEPVAPAAPAPSVVATESAPPAQPEAPPAEPTTQTPTPTPSPQPDAPESVAVVPPHHHHRAASEARFRGHPGSIELAPTTPEDPSAPTTPSGFPIAPPTTLQDTPARDLAPTAEPQSAPASGDDPLPPAAP